MYLIDLGKPSVVQIKQEPVPDSLVQLYIESFEHDEPVDEKIKEPIVRRPTSAAKNIAGRSKGDQIEDLGVEREDSEDRILDEFSLRQALSDQDERT